MAYSLDFWKKVLEVKARNRLTVISLYESIKIALSAIPEVIEYLFVAIFFLDKKG